jgi:serine/threonine protein kinase
MSTGSPGGDTQQMAQPNPLDRYEKRQLLRQKDTVEVWKALDLQQQLMVAIKLLRPNIQADRDFPARFLEKLKQVAELGHPNIVHIRDFGFAHAAVVSETKAYIIMDYVEGQTLADYLHKTSREGKFPTATELVRLLIPICLAIDYAHQQGVIHGSLKPGNILLDASNTSVNSMGQPVLSDFGMAHILGSAGGSTVAPSVYTAPEQMQGDADNERSDLYSLGVMVYELFTGVLPFQGKDPVEPIKKRFEAISDASLKPTMLTAVPGILLRNLAKNPTQRFPTAMALVIALGKAFNVPVPNPFVNPVAC